MKINLLIALSVIGLFNCCNQTKDTSNTINLDSPKVLTNNSDSSDKNFYDFLDRFNKDSVFQVNRINFPFKQIETGIENAPDSIILITKTTFKKMDLSKKEYLGEYDKWKRTIEIQGDKATILIRGIDNGIFVDYLFEKQDGKWKFIHVIDSSM